MSILERIKEFIGRYGAIVLAALGALGWILYKGKALQADALALKIKSLLLERELAKLEEKKKKDEDAFKEHLSHYTNLKREHSDIAKRLGLL